MNAVVERDLSGGDWMQTYTGKTFFPLKPELDDICIEDIAQALSKICRFGGHCRQFYSVAQHSVFVASMLPDELRLDGLMHDGTEAYLVDIPKPLKIALPDYKVIEHRLETVICKKFGVSFADPRIKQADKVALMTEARDLLGPTPAGWGVGVAPHPTERIWPMAPSDAYRFFMSAFNAYKR